MNPRRRYGAGAGLGEFALNPRCAPGRWRRHCPPLGKANVGGRRGAAAVRWWYGLSRLCARVGPLLRAEDLTGERWSWTVGMRLGTAGCGESPPRFGAVGSAPDGQPSWRSARPVTTSRWQRPTVL